MSLDSVRIVPRLTKSPRRFRVVFPSLPGEVFVVRQLVRRELFSVYEMEESFYREMMVLAYGLVSHRISELGGLPAGIPSQLANVIMKVSYLLSDQDQNVLSSWAYRNLDTATARAEIVAASVLNGVGLHDLWEMGPEEWALHIHAGMQAATLIGLPIKEYLDGGLEGLMEAIRRMQQQMAGGAQAPPPARGPVPGMQEEYSFVWRKGEPPRIRGQLR